MEKEKITFPLRLSTKVSNDINWFVFHTNASSKHQYIMDAITEKMTRDKARLEGLTNGEIRNPTSIS